MIEDRIKLKNVLTNYKISGGGKPLLILHGWGGSSNSWDKIREILSKKGYRVVSPDFPGFGKSQNPDFPWNLDDYVEWATGMIKYAELENFVLIGHSFGGRVAIKIAARYPDMVRRLILCSPAGVKMKPTVFSSLMLLLSELGNYFLSSKYLQVVKDFLRGMIYFLIKNRDYVKADGLMKEVMKKVLKEDLFFYLSRIEAKTLIVWGEIDKIVRIKYAKIFKENIKDSQLVVLPKIGHSPHLEEPQKLAQIIEDFLSE